MHVVLEEDADDPLKLVHGQAAWMAGLLAAAGVSAVPRISPGQHTWQYAMGAFAGALTCLEHYRRQYATAEAA
jgi:hypothetical protein